jgi:hypothetical protein
VLENETEISFFNRTAYEAFKQNPEVCIFYVALLFILIFFRFGGIFLNDSEKKGNENAY